MHFRVKKFVAWVMISFLSVVIPTLGYAQQQPVKDVLNAQNTPVLESAAQCLPSPVVDVDRAASRFWFSLIASVEALSGSKFHYVNVFVDYETPDSLEPPDVTKLSPWTTLIEVQRDGGCRNLVPDEQQAGVSLTKFMPLEQATQLAIARYRLELQDPVALRDFQRYIENRPGAPSGIGAEMDAIPSRNQDVEAPRICELNPEDAAAVTELGYSHKCRIRSVQ